MKSSENLRNMLWSALLGAALLVFALFSAEIPPAGPLSAHAARERVVPHSPGPDLVIQSIRTVPTYPNPGEPVNIEVVIRNAGDAKATPAFDLIITGMYVDLHREPQLGDPDTSYTGLFALNAGQDYLWIIKNHIFTAAGCDHDIWAWTDRESAVIEDNELNNKLSIQVCVGSTPTPTSTATGTPTPTTTPTPTATPCVPDVYEVGADDTCAGASPITVDSVHQMHNLCPVGDVDWVSFPAQQGITYTLSTANVGVDGDTTMLLYNQCAQPTPEASSDPAFGNGVDLVFEAPESGTYYLKVKHHDESYGDATGYELFVSPSTTCQGDTQETDDSCSTARDLAVGAAPVARQFCKPADADWAKFAAYSGATYSASAVPLGAGADPHFQIYDQCGYAAALSEGQTASWTAASSGTYYIKITNQNPNVFGSTTQYNAQIQMTACGPDAQEPDNSAAAASPFLPGGAVITGDACPAADEDWLSFDAVAGQLYVIETFELGEDGDTRICLFGSDGTTQLACDNDSGGGLASRLRWTAPAAGTFLLRVKHTDSAVGGPTTSYRLGISLGDPLDGYEPDNSAAQAGVISTDGSPQQHNFTPAADEDWVKFTVNPGDTGLPYVIQTGNLSGDCDTVLHLVGVDGTTELASNDDYGTGGRSQIAYIFTAAGTYYARVHHYRTNRSGLGTKYDISVARNQQPPTPTPSPTPPSTPGPTATPSASGIRTLIVTNRERLVALYGEESAQSVMGRLALLASDTRVKGLILQAQLDSAAATAYTLWNNSPISTTLANDTSSAVRNMILNALNTNPGVEYLVLVGNDKVLPFRRTLDRTKYPESNYQSFVTGNTPIWAACRDMMSLTDDYYADREPYTVNGQEVYVPDLALGRLPEGAGEIVAFIDNYLAAGTINLEKVLVTGYDFVVDTADTVADRIAADVGPGGTVDSTLQGDWWTVEALQGLQLQTNPRFGVQFINGHASHHLQGAPMGSGVSDTMISGSTENDLQQALIVTLGCHSGLNDTTPSGAPGGALDLAQAFFKRGANYLANTGYGWGSNAGLGWSERLVVNYVEALTVSGSTTIGKAVMTAKQRYWNESVAFDAYDEKALMESTLYGLPHFQLVSGGLLGQEDPFPSVVITSSLPLAGDDVRVGALDFSLQGALGALDEHQVTGGTYFSVNGNTDLAAGQPMQPGFFRDVTHAPAGRVHGVTLDGAGYANIGIVDPVIAQPSNEWDNDWSEPAFSGEGWSPSYPVSLQSVSTGRAFTDTVLAQLGQYNSQTGEQRLFDAMSLGVYYSASADWTPPEITYVGERLDLPRGVAVVKVEAHDISGILTGKVTYTNGDGKWRSLELVYNPGMDKWISEIPAISGVHYFVQVVDRAGNVSVADNNGRYFESPGSLVVYLPVIVKGP